jgi:hypothetical protein
MVIQPTVRRNSLGEAERRNCMFASLHMKASVPNGWVRLWLLASALLLLAAGGYVYAEIPTEARWRAHWVSSRLATQTMENEFRERKAEKCEAAAINAIVCEQYRIRLPGEVALDREIDELGEAHLREGLFEAQIRLVGFVILAWFLTVAALYFLGAAVGWVIRGFRAGTAG